MLERKTRDITESKALSTTDKSVKERERSSLGQTGPLFSMTAVYAGETYVPISQPQYTCTNCGKKYKWQDSLKRHQRVECGNKEKKFSCHFCDRKFKYRYELRNHNFAHHRP
ncbi:longitudinals lacking protein-like [Cephus cinctus]|uniref:Longitudinals lacking protein-like n=1 Tax=Cephus cinctus TaxID=211228 RepID=A0AAJ7VXU2_CEPCN|nr:longitudinals lacking protein-like [Cephus cinctus]